MDIFRVLPELGWTPSLIIIDNPPNYTCWRKGDKTLKLLDSTNYWKISLKELGNRVGLNKLDMPPEWADRERADTYCKRDVSVLLLALQQWIAWLRQHRLGGLGISLAQQAWRAYVHRFLECPIYIDDNIEALELSRSSYYGGRTEALTVGTYLTDVQCLDVNSMYPSVMRDYEYPTRLHGRYTRIKAEELNRWLGKYAVTADCTIRTERPFFPSRSPNGLLFPVGTFRTYLSTPEIKAALDSNELVECHAAAIYDKGIIFRGFIDELYALRQEFAAAGDESGRYFVKILMNSLYGKFGQRAGNEEIVGECDPGLFRVETEIDVETGKRYRWRYIGGKILCRSTEAEGRYSHPAIVSHVTAYARCLLWRHMETAGIENVFYMDTDSLHVNREGMTRLLPAIDPTRLGALKLEKVVQRAIYYGPKDYELDGKRVIKGVRANATELGPGHFSQAQWVSIKGATVAEHRGAPLVRQITKRFTRQYRKGHVGPQGKVSPLRLALEHVIAMVKKD